MARFCGKIGYAVPTVTDGVAKDEIIEVIRYGNVIKNYRNLDSGSSINDNIVVGNQISIVADAYLLQNFHAIRYVEWMHTKRKVTSVEVEPPRLILSFGGVYNVDTD